MAASSAADNTPGAWSAYQGVAWLVAAVAAAALALQLVLIVARMTGEGASVAGALWRYLGFFTILTNGVVVVAAARMARSGGPGLDPRAGLAVAVAIAVVGVTYSLALRGIWQPTGWQAVADHALHDAVPPLFLLAWALGPHGALRWRDAAWAMAPGAAYGVYALARGAVDGWYAYWFFDPSKMGAAGLLAACAALLAGFLVVGLLLVAADRWLARSRLGRSRLARARPGA